VHEIKSSIVQSTKLLQSTKLSKFKEIPVCNVIISKETILTQGYQLALNAMQLLAAVDVEFRTVAACSGLGLTTVKCDIDRLSRVAKDQVSVRC